MSDTIEFYHDGEKNPFFSLLSSFQPNDGDLMNIRGVTYRVIGRSFTVDHLGDLALQKIRCNVILEKYEE